MNENDAKLGIAKAALQLRGADRPGWDAFLASLAAYSTHTDSQCVASPPDMVLVMQGRARNMRELLKILHDSPGTVEMAKARTHP